MKKLFLITLLAAAFYACKSTTPEPADLKPSEKSAIVVQYADLGFAMYTDAVVKAKDLQIAINTFTANPTATGLENCKLAWQNSRVPYAYTEAFRFYGGPIDDAQNGPESLINAWPLDEAFMDYISTKSVSGIINDLVAYPSITSEILINSNQVKNETDVCTGYHAIEFLLWGQDLSATGPGARPFTDFIDGGTAANQGRRRAYLKVVTDLLITHLEQVALQWDPAVSGENYRKNFIRPSELNNSLAKILIGLGKYTKGEMSGQRISVSHQNEDQEDEHDCFSDYTMTDIRNWQKGLTTIYTGEYIRTDGTKLAGESISSYMTKYYPEENSKILAKFSATDATLATITTTFDQALFKTNQDYSKISTLIVDLRNQADSYLTAVEKLNILSQYNNLNLDDN